MAESARSVCGVVKLHALVEALDLVVLDACPVLMVSYNHKTKEDFKVVLLDFVDEVELDAHRRQFVHRGRVLVIFMFVELRVGVVAIIIGYLNDAVVCKATLESGFLSLRIPRSANVDSACRTRRLEEARVKLTELMVSVKRAHPVTLLAAESIAVWWVCERRIMAVKVPVRAAVVASNDRTLAQG